MAKKPENCIGLPEFTDDENAWCVAVLAIPTIKPKRAAILFVTLFDRFLGIPVDKDEHPDIKDKYYPADTVVYCVIKKFYYFRSDPNAANYKAIQAKKALYSKIYSDYMELSTVFDIFELILVFQEMYSGIKEYDKNKLTILKQAVKMRVLL